VLAAAAGSVLVAATTPFTPAADAAVAAAIGLAVLVLVAQAVGTPGVHPWSRWAGAGRRPTRAAAAPWLALFAAAAAWELFSYFAGRRAAHPTLSSAYDALAQWRAAKAVVVFCWLALGWYLVRA
jgi:hypothetical protein